MPNISKCITWSTRIGAPTNITAATSAPRRLPDTARAAAYIARPAPTSPAGGRQDRGVRVEQHVGRGVEHVPLEPAAGADRREIPRPLVQAPDREQRILMRRNQSRAGRERPGTRDGRGDDGDDGGEPVAAAGRRGRRSVHARDAGFPARGRMAARLPLGFAACSRAVSRRRRGSWPSTSSGCRGFSSRLKYSPSAVRA